MLVLSRLQGERIRIDTASGVIWLTACDVRGATVKIGVEAPPLCAIHREEILPEAEQYAATRT